MAPSDEPRAGELRGCKAAQHTKGAPQGVPIGARTAITPGATCAPSRVRWSQGRSHLAVDVGAECEGVQTASSSARSALQRRRFSARSCRTSREYTPCLHRARWLRPKPSGVRGPVLFPPCRRQRRRLRIAGQRQPVPRRVLAPHRGAVEGSPRGFPFRRGPRSRSMGSIRRFPLPPPGARPPG